MVEHCTENAGVGGSIPPLGTTKKSKKFSVRSRGGDEQEQADAAARGAFANVATAAVQILRRSLTSIFPAKPVR